MLRCCHFHHLKCCHFRCWSLAFAVGPTGAEGGSKGKRGRKSGKISIFEQAQLCHTVTWLPQHPLFSVSQLPVATSPSLQLPLFISLENSLRRRFHPEFLCQLEELLSHRLLSFVGEALNCFALPLLWFFFPGSCLSCGCSHRCAYFKLGVISPTLIRDKISIVPWCEMEMQRQTRAELNGNLNLPGYYPPVKYNHSLNNWAHQQTLNWLLMIVMEHMLGCRCRD